MEKGIPLVLIIGEEEKKKGIYKVKALNEEKEYEFTMDALVDGVQKLIEANPVLIPKEETACVLNYDENKK